jgi:hypothetical protein
MHLPQCGVSVVCTVLTAYHFYSHMELDFVKFTPLMTISVLCDRSNSYILWHVSQLLGCAAGVAQQSAAWQRPLNNSRQNTRCAAVRDGGVFSAQQRWRHTAARSLPRQRCCKHIDATQLSPDCCSDTDRKHPFQATGNSAASTIEGL